MLIYADGSALSRSVTDAPEAAAWAEWFAAHADEVVTSPLGLTELRQAAAPLGSDARARARALADSLTVVRFYDEALDSAAMAQGVLPPFAAIHLGIARTHAEVGAIATYDPRLAQVAILHGMQVVTPGRGPDWWA